ncbi:MAG TPA: hypothetical protein VK629_09325 [Steroidobacteraceae bacterium]|nr:hypothetical protein [Steroidobacteraceae bacterium]
MKESRGIASSIAVAAVLLLVVASHFRQVRLAYWIYEDEEAPFLTEEVGHVYLIGYAELPSSATSLLAAMYSDGPLNGTALHRNGCFSLRSSETGGTLEIFGKGLKTVSKPMQNGFFIANVTVFEDQSERDSRIEIVKVKPWDYIRRTIACTASA